MSREIKFRAWDKEYRYMIKPDEIHPRVMEECITGEGKVLEVEENHSYSGTLISYYDITEKRVLMQYTGQRDQNNKEIFEGDICYFTPMLVETLPTFKGVVEWDKYRFAIRNLDSDQLYATPYVNLDLFGISVEIIGNIYENPELL